MIRPGAGHPREFDRTAGGIVSSRTGNRKKEIDKTYWSVLREVGHVEFNGRPSMQLTFELQRYYSYERVGISIIGRSC